MTVEQLRHYLAGLPSGLEVVVQPHPDSSSTCAQVAGIALGNTELYDEKWGRDYEGKEYFISHGKVGSWGAVCLMLEER